ncbi:MAG: type II toxin-antitoxin system RelE/ParE family toxin [Pirellulales bacterium]|nr:type II toxin-antitoxin system RelE/ParE family toxin [Pirellulales bacterium]
MEAQPQQLRTYLTEGGRCPFADWLERLRDRRAQQRIDARLTRVELGNFGDARGVGDGVMELRIDYGPGYRVYFGRDGDRVVLLLLGGDKRSQSRDIDEAKAYWADYKLRKSGPVE